MMENTFYFFFMSVNLAKFVLESQVTDKLYYIMLYTSPWSRFELTTSVVIGTDCIGSGTSIYHTIMTTTAPPLNGQPSFKPKIYIQYMYNSQTNNQNPYFICFVCEALYLFRLWSINVFDWKFPIQTCDKQCNWQCLVLRYILCKISCYHMQHLQGINHVQ
jgi:hypothetical protein